MAASAAAAQIHAQALFGDTISSQSLEHKFDSTIEETELAEEEKQDNKELKETESESSSPLLSERQSEEQEEEEDETNSTNPIVPEDSEETFKSAEEASPLHDLVQTRIDGIDQEEEEETEYRIGAPLTFESRFASAISFEVVEEESSGHFSTPEKVLEKHTEDG